MEKKYTGSLLKKSRSDIITNSYKEVCDIKSSKLEFQLEEQNTKEKKVSSYIPNKDLIGAVELTRLLKRPLLIKGEPGCGKTKLAEAVAMELYHNKEDNTNAYKKHYFEWHVKSNSSARDGLYTIDHLARLRDANDTNADKKELDHYISLGPFGKALITSTKENPSILLIDEIDKADIDFPNDLLLELDEGRFVISEMDPPLEFEALHPPIIFITSNEERELPPAFIRRCLFSYISFPTKELLNDIIRSKFPDFDAKIRTSAIQRFIKLRDGIKNDRSKNRNISTSELIDWITVLEAKTNPDLIEKVNDETQVPFHQVLLKDVNDLYRNKLLSNRL